MIVIVIGISLFAVIVLLSVTDEIKQRRESEEINRDLKRENMVRQNTAELRAFRMQLDREQFWREYDLWNATQWWLGK